MRRLGRTGHRSSVAILGGAAFSDADPDTTESAFRAALDVGVNHLDVAPHYGRAEALLGPCIPAVRDRLFVACKTLRHGADGVRAQLEESLSVLRCDSFDLYQLHAVTDLEELDARSGAVEAMLAARDEGLCRWVGITGHGLGAPAAHLEALRRFDLDTVMVPGEPAAVVGPGLPAGCGGPVGPRRRARRRGHGHQGAGGPAVGRPAPDFGHLVRAVHASRRGGRRHPLRPLDTGRARLLHPGRHRSSSPRRWPRPTRSPRMAGPNGTRPMAAAAGEPSIFSAPVP